MTFDDAQAYERVKTKWLRENPQYVHERFALLEAAVDKAFTAAFGWTGRPDDRSPWQRAQANAPRTPREMWEALAAEAPDFYSQTGTRNGNGRP